MIFFLFFKCYCSPGQNMAFFFAAMRKNFRQVEIFTVLFLRTSKNIIISIILSNFFITT